MDLAFDDKTGEIASTTNLTILNVFLLRLGPMREDSLTRVLIATQVRSTVSSFDVPSVFRSPSVGSLIRSYFWWRARAE